MHDPMTVAFDIRSPFRNKPNALFPKGYREAIVTVWHVDPEVCGDDDSCMSARRLYLGQGRSLDDEPDWARAETERYRARLIERSGWLAKRLPWRAHVWHWRIQIHAVQTLKRWLWSRCETCGGRFAWGYAPISRQWGGPGPTWFRGEPHVLHHECAGQVFSIARATQEVLNG